MSLSAFKEKIIHEAKAEAEKVAHAHTLIVQQERSRVSKELRALEETVVGAAEKEAYRQGRSIHQRAALEGR